MSRRIKDIAVGVLVLAAAVSGWLYFFSGRAFDPVQWKDEASVRAGARLPMADHLIANGTLLGKTKEEVLQLLGTPPETGYFSDWDLVYWLGPERGFMSIDSEWLVLRFGSDGHVIENCILRD